jgi:hypothetical protein
VNQPFHPAKAGDAEDLAAVKTSRSASWNSRPASTRRRASSTHSLGMRSTRFFPLAMKVKDQAGCPGPEAQWQAGLPQRV